MSDNVLLKISEDIGEIKATLKGLVVTRADDITRQNDHNDRFYSFIDKQNARLNVIEGDKKKVVGFAAATGMFSGFIMTALGWLIK